MSAARHISVMLDEAVDALNVFPGGVYVDATFGAGGYSKAILEAADCSVYAFDRDPRAISEAQELVDAFDGRLVLINRPFADMEAALAEHQIDQIDGVVFDLGVSSMQLDEADRGFSFMRDGPLSMRMDGGKPDAADVVTKASAEELAAIFKAFGEERHGLRLARAIVDARDARPVTTTLALAEIIERAAPPSARRQTGKAKIHPATRVFQALRIFVNGELRQLAEGLAAAERMLKVAGRLVAVTFHSLEDRIVKRFFAERSATVSAASRHQPVGDLAAPSFKLLFNRALAASADEIDVNVRSRSAKLRAGVRLDAKSHPVEFGRLGVPQHHRIPELEGVI
ncbi:MAG: 16S rRNA (cytosine(1402)-N(4))-methyltransferase RsmH [Pseudomonadota bacterium]